MFGNRQKLKRNRIATDGPPVNFRGLVSSYIFFLKNVFQKIPQKMLHLKTLVISFHPSGMAPKKGPRVIKGGQKLSKITLKLK